MSKDENPAPSKHVDGPTAEQERLRFEGDLDKWMKIIGAGITGYQPEAYAVMDLACEELVKLRKSFAVMEHFVNVCAEDGRVRSAYPGLADRANSIVKSLGIRASLASAEVDGCSVKK